MKSSTAYDYDSTAQYYFDGWYLDEDYKTKYSTESFFVANPQPGGATLYAKWAQKQSLTVRLGYKNFISSNGSVYPPRRPQVTVEFHDESFTWDPFKGTDAWQYGNHYYKDRNWHFNDDDGVDDPNVTFFRYFKPGEEVTLTFFCSSGSAPQGKRTATFTPDGESDYVYTYTVENNNTAGGGANPSEGDCVFTLIDEKAFPLTYIFFMRNKDGGATPIVDEGNLSKISNPNPTGYTHSGIEKLKDAVYPGCAFEGWYTDFLCTQPFTSLDGTAYDDAEVFLYGVFTQGDELTIHYEGNGMPGATAPEDSSVEFDGISEFTLPDMDGVDPNTKCSNTERGIRSQILLLSLLRLEQGGGGRRHNAALRG